MMPGYRNLVIFFLSCVVVMAGTQPALADIMNMQLNSGLSCSGGAASGSLFNPGGSGLGGCSTGNGFLARFICLFETTLGMVLATFFCHLQQAWTAPLAAMILILMTATGIMFVTGMLEFTVKEVAVLMFKLGLVATFALNTDIALNIAFKFFLGVTQDTVRMLSAGLNGGATPSLGEADSQTAAASAKIPTSCKILIVVLMFFMPFVFGIFLLIAAQAAMFFKRAAFGYLYSLAMLTFLVAAMPIFVSFALFKITRDLFESWIKSMVSNSVQIMLVFAFLAFAKQMDMTGFITDITRLFTLWEVKIGYGWFSWNIADLCTICEPNIDMNTLTIAPNPNQCKGDAVPWTKLGTQGDFLYYLLVHSVTLYIVTATMSEFMKEVPDLAQTLGGHGGGMVIGGLSRKYGTSGGNALVAPGLTTAGINLEQGIAHALKGGKTFQYKGSGGLDTVVGRVFMNSAPMRMIAAVVEGANSIRYGASTLTAKEERHLEQYARMKMAEATQQCMTCQTDIDSNSQKIEQLEKDRTNLMAGKRQLQEDLRNAEEALKQAVEARYDGSEAGQRRIELEKEYDQQHPEAAQQLAGAEQKQQEAQQALQANVDEADAIRTQQKELEERYKKGKVNAADYKKSKAELDKKLAENVKESEKLRNDYKDATQDLHIATAQFERRKAEWISERLNEETQNDSLNEQKQNKKIDDAVEQARLNLQIAEKRLELHNYDSKINETDLASTHTQLTNAQTASERAEAERVSLDKKFSSRQYKLGLLPDEYGNILGSSHGLQQDIWGGHDEELYLGEHTGPKPMWYTLLNSYKG